MGRANEGGASSPGQPSLSSLPGPSPLLSMSSAIWEASRASPSITGQMGWLAPEMVKPAASILLRNLKVPGGVRGQMPELGRGITRQR